MLFDSSRNGWTVKHFGTDLPNTNWRDDAYPSYFSPFIYLDGDIPNCDLAGFGIVPQWAIAKKNFANSKYNARIEIVAEKYSYRFAWKEKRFGLVLMDSFYEPNYEVAGVPKKSMRYRIKRTDGNPQAAACIY